MNFNIKLEKDGVIYEEGDIISVKGMIDVPVEIQKANIILIQHNLVKVHVIKGIAKRKESEVDLEGRQLNILLCNIDAISLNN